ncbi:DUF4974 domain-containing protein [Echinicola sp. CAU 1574]|uniref:DUF4974 domain-containing protein n=1 Tax=Echinicola arenosa TaxID=2774144 RepID=A0ABR9AI64_9BACT|nr:FecR family protein [Echinicola arenosa]MBD8487309.1 DUF4974 domain-containing protein [Echinicola arenosa]
MDREKQIRDFHNGTLSKEEAEEFLEWYTSDEGEAYMSHKLEQNWKIKADIKREDPWDQDTLFKRIFKDPKILTQEKRGSQRPLILYWNNSSAFRVAASLLFLFAISFLFYQYFNQQELGNDLGSSTDWIVKCNPAGQKSRFILPDGSKIFLNAQSTLKYSKDFKTNRNIVLEGEAYFEVFPDKEHPFRVSSKELTTTALGTAFNIKAFKNSPEIEVVLTHGKIKVEAGKSDFEEVLFPGQGVISESGDGNFRKEQMDVEKVIYWKDGILYFSDTHFEEVLKTLERWYDVKISVTGNYDKDFLCSGTFDKNEYLNNVLDILGHSIGFEYKIDKKKVDLKFHP